MILDNGSPKISHCKIFSKLRLLNKSLQVDSKIFCESMRGTEHIKSWKYK